MPVPALDLNLRHLRAVAAIAESGSVSAAAAAVGLSQPALTQGLAKLEARLGLPLFARQSAGMTATVAGRIMASRAEEAFALLGVAMRAVRRGAARGFARPEWLLTAAQLRALLALAEAGSFVSAAAATGLSQPALHRAVRDIERLAGVPLAERRGRGIVLTEAGRRAARGFRLARSAIAAGVAELRPAGGGGEIAVGAMPLARARLLPAAIARVHASHPAAAFRIVEGAHRELTDQLRDGYIDITVGALREPPPGPDLVQRPLFVDQLVVVARADHPLVTVGAPTSRALVAYPWIIGAKGTPLRGHWDMLFAGCERPAAPIDCGSVMTIRGLLLSGDYLTLLSPDQVWVELESGLLGIVGTPFFDGPRCIGVTVRESWRPTATQQDFLTALDITAREGLPKNQ